VGAEAAYIAHQFGAAVTVVERATRLLPSARVPEHAVDLLERKLERIGVEVRTETVPTGCQVAEGRARVTLNDGYEGDFGLVLVAVGRLPNTAGIGLDAIGVQTTEDGHIRTNEYLETGARGVYAIGDVRAGPMTASAALYDAKLVVANALGSERVRRNYHKVPFAVHSALEIAAVGLTQERAEEAGFTPAVARVGLGASSKARACHDYEGFIEVVHDVETGQLLGGCIVGPEAGEQIMLVEAACQSQRGMWFLKDLSYSHPSWCEEIEVAVDPSAASLVRTAVHLDPRGILANE
jgi:dihydrolipoamide dehydrogenase